MSDLFAELPQLGPGDRFKGPSYEIPLELCSYFTHFLRRENEGQVQPQFEFHKLKVVEKVRFVELCRKYGWEGEYPRDYSRHYFTSGRWGIPGLLPLSQWEPDDEAELRSLMDVAQAQ